MNVFDVAAELAASLELGGDLRVYPYPPDAVVAPAAIVGYPQTITFDASYRRGLDTMTIPVYVLVDRTWDRASAEQFAGLTAGAGASSIKRRLETKPHEAFSSARVRSVDFSVISVASIEYWCATFLVDVYGSGA